jgi:hypothetical protein
MLSMHREELVMEKSRKNAVDLDAALPSLKRPTLATAGASLVGTALALVIIGWGALRSATARA